MKLLYLGTPQLAVPPLRALVAAGHEVSLVVSQPDRRRGRGSSLQPSPVKAAATELGLDVTDRVEDVTSVDAELGVVVAYGRIIKPDVLSVVPMVNLHFSLLPRWRGAAPVERAMLAGDPVTGVCVMEVVEALDAGGVYATAEVPIGPDSTLAELTGTLVEVGTELLVETLGRPLETPQPQQGEVVYAQKIQPEERRLDLAQTAELVNRTIRLGGAWLEFRDKRLRIWKATVDESGPAQHRLVDGVLGTANGGLRLIEVQPENKHRMAANDWLNGAQPTQDDWFG